MPASRFEVRAPTREEAGAIAGLLNDRARVLRGRSDASVDEIRSWFDAPDLDPDQDFRIAVLADARLAGYVDVGDPAGDGRTLWIDLRVHPDSGGRPVAEALLDAAEARARQRAAPGAKVRGFASDDDALAAACFEARGYRVIRSSFRMAIELDGELPSPVPPEGISIRPFRPGEERLVYDASHDAFADTWDFTPTPYEEWLYWSTSGDHDPSLWFLAEDGEEVAGVSLCRPTAHGDPDCGWVSTLGVRPPWRRRGLGRALLLHSFAEFRRRGLEAAALGVDAESPTGAVRLYERAGMHVERRNDVYERPV